MIFRKSDDSSITIPYDRTFRRLGESADPSDAKKREQFRFCGCGWPQHMLLPKGKMKKIIVIFLNLILIFYVGTPEGTVFEFIVMISNYEDDIIDGPIDT